MKYLLNIAMSNNKLDEYNAYCPQMFPLSFLPAAGGYLEETSKLWLNCEQELKGKIFTSYSVWCQKRRNMRILNKLWNGAIFFFFFKVILTKTLMRKFTEGMAKAIQTITFTQGGTKIMKKQGPKGLQVCIPGGGFFEGMDGRGAVLVRRFERVVVFWRFVWSVCSRAWRAFSEAKVVNKSSIHSLCVISLLFAKCVHKTR